MECKFAYLREDVPYVLCKKEPEPSRNDRTALFHAVCGHQAECPKVNCHRLTASWVNCTKLRDKPQNAVGATSAAATAEDEPKAKTAQKGRRKPQKSE